MLTLLDALHTRWVAVYRAMTPDHFARTFFHPELGEHLTLDRHVQLCGRSAGAHFVDVHLGAAARVAIGASIHQTHDHRGDQQRSGNQYGGHQKLLGVRDSHELTPRKEPRW